LEKELQKELFEEFEKHLASARSCPMTPGSLEKIMTKGAERMARLTQEALAQAASDEADFPPSGVSSLRGGESAQPEGKAEASGDGVGGDPV
jgi:hypothetical protein